MNNSNKSRFGIYHFLSSLSDRQREQFLEALPFLAPPESTAKFEAIVRKAQTNPQSLTDSERQVVDAFVKWIGPLPQVPKEPSGENEKVNQ